MTRSFDLVLFDLDGTLLETAPEIAAALNASLAKMGLPTVDARQIGLWIGHGVRELVVQAFGYLHPQAEAGADAAQIEEAMELFEWHYATIYARQSQLFPGAAQTIAALRSADVKCALVSNKETRFVELLLAEHRLQEQLDLLICGDTLPRKKPDPAPVLHAIKHFGVLRERTLFVGDSEIDLACGRAAGVAVWLVPYGYNQGRPVSGAGADRVIETLSEVARACTVAPRSANLSAAPVQAVSLPT